MEIRPKVNWHKGTALNHLLDVLGLRSQPDVVAIYIVGRGVTALILLALNVNDALLAQGDDRTDEDAFRALLEGCQVRKRCLMTMRSIGNTTSNHHLFRCRATASWCQARSRKQRHVSLSETLRKSSSYSGCWILSPVPTLPITTPLIFPSNIDRGLSQWADTEDNGWRGRASWRGDTAAPHPPSPPAADPQQQAWQQWQQRIVETPPQ